MIGVVLIFNVCELAITVPGCPRGYVGPGGLAASTPGEAHCTGGAHRCSTSPADVVLHAHHRTVCISVFTAAFVAQFERLLLRVRYIDEQLFGEHHMLHTSIAGSASIASAAPCSSVYKCAAFDPEGVLGILSASVLVFTGVHAARILTFFRKVRHSAAADAAGVLVVAPRSPPDYGVLYCRSALHLLFSTLAFGVLLLCFMLWRLCWCLRRHICRSLCGGYCGDLASLSSPSDFVVAWKTVASFR
jgi:hypothetical protein